MSVDVPDGAELWVGIEEQDGFAPSVILGGNPDGLRLLAALATALASTGTQGGTVHLRAGDLLLAGSEADLVLAIQSEDG